MKKFTDIKKKIKIISEGVETPMNVAVPSVVIMTTDELEGGKDVEIAGQIAVGEITKSEPAKFFSKLFESREMAHIYHLQVNGGMGSHAEHTALNDYYDIVLELIDQLIETYQGQHEIVEGYDIIDTTPTKTKDAIEYFTDLVMFIKATRYKAILQEDTHLQNIIDEIVAVIYRLLYKIKYTK